MLQLSVVISTYNRREILCRVIERLACQDLPPDSYEVIVTDDGSVDGTSKSVKELQSAVPFVLKYSWHTNRGPGYTHNRGIQAASAPVVLLLADDILLAPRALSAHLNAHLFINNPQWAVLGQVLQAPEVKQSVFMRHWEPNGFMKLLPDHFKLPYTFFWAHNISIHRDFLLAGGLFREDLGTAGPAAHEDVELGCRLARHGMQICYFKNAAGFHFHPETLDSAMQRAYQRGLNWLGFAEAAGDERISIRYHILWKRAFAVHLRAIFTKQCSASLDRDRNAWMFLKNIMRPLVFNRFSISWFWRPLLQKAETENHIAAWMHGSFYRGVVQYYFRKGIRNGRKLAGCEQRCTPLASALEPLQ